MKFSTLFLLFFLFFETSFLAAQPSLPPPKASFVALVDATIHPLYEPVLRQGMILIQDGRIVQIGANLVLPPDTVVYRLQGKRIYPGLILPNFQLDSNTSGTFAEQIDLYQDWVEFLLSSGITTVALKLSRSKQTVIVHLNPNDPQKSISPVEAPLFGLTPFFQSSKAFFDLRQKLYQAQEQLREAQSQSAEKKLKETPFTQLLQHRSTGWVELNASKDLERLLRLVRETKIKVVVVGAEEAWICAQELAQAGIQCILFTRQSKTSHEPTTLQTGASLRNATLLYEAGVKFALSVPDTSIKPWGTLNQNVLTFHLEPAFAIKEGLSEEVALRSITADPAEILGIALDVGMLRPGMRANLAVFNGEIFHYQTLCEMTFVDGQLVYDRNRSSLYSQIPSRK